MITGELDAREEALIAVAREAGERARQFFLKPIDVKMKGKQDFITEADNGANDRKKIKNNEYIENMDKMQNKEGGGLRG